MTKRIALLPLLLSLAACQTMAGAGAVSERATVNLGEPATRAAVTEVLARAVGRARIELGPTDGPLTAIITVLPPPPGPYETNSMAMPVRFDIELREEGCVAVRHDTGQAYPLASVQCEPA